jgi:hypothetical protein
VQSQQTAAPTRSGLQVVLDVIVAPKAAFESLRAVPTWGWALIISIVIAMIGTYLGSPGAVHAMVTEAPAKAAQMLPSATAEKREELVAQQIAMGQTITKFTFLFVAVILPIISLCQALVMLLVNAIARGDGTFKKFFALSVNVSIIYGISTILLGLIIMLRGADSFNSQADIYAGLPSLALLAPGASKGLTAFLGQLNVFTIWSTVLLVMGMGIIARIPRGFAIGAGTFMLFCGAGFAALAAK